MLQQHRNAATTDLLAGLVRMRLSLLTLVVVGAGVSIAAALLIARAISVPTVRLTQTMTALAEGSLEVEIPDRERTDEIGAMANAVQIFKENMVKRRSLASEIVYLAHHDALTNLANRVLFQENLQRELGYVRRVAALRSIIWTSTTSRQ